MGTYFTCVATQTVRSRTRAGLVARGVAGPTRGRPRRPADSPTPRVRRTRHVSWPPPAWRSWLAVGPTEYSSSAPASPQNESCWPRKARATTTRPARGAPVASVSVCRTPPRSNPLASASVVAGVVPADRVPARAGVPWLPVVVDSSRSGGCRALVFRSCSRGPVLPLGAAAGGAGLCWSWTRSWFRRSVPVRRSRGSPSPRWSRRCRDAPVCSTRYAPCRVGPPAVPHRGSRASSVRTQIPVTPPDYRDDTPHLQFPPFPPSDCREPALHFHQRNLGARACPLIIGPCTPLDPASPTSAPSCSARAW